jgi:hypothetical protein
MFTVCFSLQEKYKDEVIKMHSEGFDWENEPIDGQAVYASGGGKAHGHLDAVYYFNFVNARYMTLLLFFFLFLRYALFNGMVDSREAMSSKGSSSQSSCGLAPCVSQIHLDYDRVEE